MDISKILNSKGNEDFLEIIKCQICFQISLNPVACKKCETVFCQECIENWKKNSKSCPLRCQNMQLNSDSRILRNILSKFIYKCEKCENKISLNDHFSHDKVCSEDLINCENGCGELLRKSFKETHLKLFCSNTIIKCKCCASLLKRKDYPIKEESEISRIKELENELKIKDEIIKIHTAKQNENLATENKMISLSSPNKVLDNFNFVEKFNIKSLLKKENSNNYMAINHVNILNFKDENHLVLSITSGDVIHFNLTLNNLVKIYNNHKDNITDLKIVKNYLDEYIIITASFDSHIASVNLKSKEIKLKSLSSVASCLLASLTKDIIIVGDVSGHIRMLLVEGFEEIINKQAHKARITNIQFTDNKEYLLSFAKDNTISITDIVGFNVIKSIMFETQIMSSVTLPGLNTVYLTNDKGDIYVYSRENRQIISLKYQNNFKPSSTKIFAYNIDNENFLILFNTLSGISYYKINKPDDKIVLLNNYKDNSISAMNVIETDVRIENDNKKNIGIDVNIDTSNINNLMMQNSNNLQMIDSLQRRNNLYSIFTKNDGCLYATLLN